MRFLRKNGWKFLLDVVLTVLLTLMYNKRVLGMEFHEIGGLALYGLFIIHKLLNGKWIRAVTAGLFSRRTPVRQKVYWLLDLLLFGCFTFIIVTGILISKIIFPSSGGGMNAKIAHYAVSAFALALAGIHAGLHLSWARRQISFLVKIPSVVRRVLAIVLSVAVLAFGSLQLTSTSFLNWIGNLRSLSTVETFPVPDSGEGTSATLADADTTAAVDTTAQENDQSDTAAASGLETGHGKGNGKRQGLRDGLGPHGSGNGYGAEAGGSSVWTVLASFLGIFMAFAVAAAWLDGGLWALKRRRLRKTAQVPPSI